MSADELLCRWARLKSRVLEMKRERERCEEERAAEWGPDGRSYEPGSGPCWDAGPEGDGYAMRDRCGACQRNQVRYLYRLYTQKALLAVQRRMLKFPPHDPGAPHAS